MGSDVRHVRGEAQKELVKKFEVFTSKGRSRWQVWSDWITISAIAVSNATDKSHFDEREQQYMTIVKKYTKQEVDAFADMFSILVMALEDNSEQDFLGELYMCLGLGSDHAGQFFTPYHLCEFMSAVTTPAEEFQQKIGDRGWVAVCDPTCGAGALLVAFANECRKKEINYQTDVLFVAQDIDYIVGMMCYLQMSLLGIPAIRSKGYGPQGHSFGASRRGMESGFAAIWCISISEIIGQNRNFTAVESGGRTERPSSSGNATGAKKLSISCASARSCPRCCWPPLARISRTRWHPTLTNLRVMFGKC